MRHENRGTGDALTDLIEGSAARGWSHRTLGLGAVPFGAGIDTWSDDLRAEGVGDRDVIRVNVRRSTAWAEIVLSALRRKAVVWLDAPRDGPAWERVASQNTLGLHPDAALILPTSGSTGSRKHVPVTRQELVDFASVIARRYELTDADVTMLFTEPPFDVVVEEVFGALAAGATVVAPEHRVMMPVEFAECCDQLGVTVANLPTSYALQLAQLASGPIETPLKTLVIGGERLSWDGAEALLATFPGVTVLNAYGLTECCVTSLVHEVGDPLTARVDGTQPFGVPIGRPLDGVELRVSAEREIVDPDADYVIGELIVGGRRIANGYLAATPSDPGSPFTQDRSGNWFHTGDRVAWQPSTGLYWFLGRYDNQVKVQGQRVELEYLEQECAIVDPGRRWAAVPIRSAFGEVTLIRLVSDNPALANARARQEIERAIRRRLAAPALPVKVVHVPELPRLQGDKINRRLLEERLNGEIRR